MKYVNFKYMLWPLINNKILMKPKLILAVILGLFIGVAAGLYIGQIIAQQPVSTEKEIIIEEPAEQEGSIKIYFSSTKDNEGFLDCSKTDFVIREIKDNENLAQETMMQMFAGPTEEEKARGLQPFWITEENAGALGRIFIKDGTAYLDWNEDESMLTSGANSSCGSQSFLSPIEATLKGLPGVQRVVHAINGSPETFYEWMQMVCDERNSFCDETPFI